MEKHNVPHNKTGPTNHKPNNESDFHRKCTIRASNQPLLMSNHGPPFLTQKSQLTLWQNVFWEKRAITSRFDRWIEKHQSAVKTTTSLPFTPKFMRTTPLKGPFLLKECAWVFWGFCPLLLGLVIDLANSRDWIYLLKLPLLLPIPRPKQIHVLFQSHVLTTNPNVIVGRPLHTG